MVVDKLVPLSCCSVLPHSRLKDAQLLQDIRDGDLLEQVLIAFDAQALVPIRSAKPTLLSFSAESLIVQLLDFKEIPLDVVLLLYGVTLSDLLAQGLPGRACRRLSWAIDESLAQDKLVFP
mmetsp:Transcript_31358/g.41531  ORF Transcript_31358/g.41531 Transcript_31358/m.41531 type:complete len:121 (-) Transcript_31358:1131-1493(-)